MFFRSGFFISTHFCLKTSESLIFADEHEVRHDVNIGSIPSTASKSPKAQRKPNIYNWLLVINNSKRQGHFCFLLGRQGFPCFLRMSRSDPFDLMLRKIITLGSFTNGSAVARSKTLRTASGGQKEVHQRYKSGRILWPFPSSRTDKLHSALELPNPCPLNQICSPSLLLLLLSLFLRSPPQCPPTRSQQAR